MDKLHEDSRKQFEKYFDDFYGCHPTDYHDQNYVEGRWHTWQASRASIVVDLPDTSDIQCQECADDALSRCEKILRSMGLSIKWE